jgi:hypothetical protein
LIKITLGASRHLHSSKIIKTSPRWWSFTIKMIISRRRSSPVNQEISLSSPDHPLLIQTLWHYLGIMTMLTYF